MRISRYHNVREVAARGSTARALALSAEASTSDTPISGLPPPMPVTMYAPPVANTSKEFESVLATTSPKEDLRCVSTAPSHSCSLKSCWLETSFQLLFAATNKNFAQFSMICQPLPEDSGLKALHTALYERQRESLWKLLQARGLLGAIGSFEPFCGWLAELIRLESISGSPRVASYFEVLLVEVHSSGSPDIGAQHVETTNRPIRRRINQLSARHHKQYHGRFSEYFADLTSSEKDPAPQSSPVWPVHETKVLASERKEDIRTLLISLPVLLVIEVADEIGSGRAYDPLEWDFPQTVSPTMSSSDEDGCIYDLVGLAMVDSSGSHFVAGFPSDDIARTYTCDDDEDCGIPAREFNCPDVNSVVVAHGVEIHPGFKICSAFYHLRGGFEAQDKFCKSRTNYYSHRYNLEFSEFTPGQPCMVLNPSLDLDVLGQCKGFWTSTGKEHWVERAPQDKPLELQALQPEHVEEPNPFDIAPSFLPENTDWFSPMISLRCRCGMTGQGSILFRLDDGPSIQCQNCGTRSHIACQRLGKVTAQVPFICDACDPQTLSIKRPDEMVDRLQPGCGAFARAGDYWYPVRLIQRANDTAWWVRWWRQCVIERIDVRPGRVSVVNSSDIIDSFRKSSPISLGYWTPACNDTSATAAILRDPFPVCYTDEAFMALGNSVELIRQLVFRPETVANALVPAKAWLEANHKNITQSFVPYCGGLSVVDRAQIANWFATKIGIRMERESRWFGSLAQAHAHTLVLAYRIRCATPLGVPESFIFRKAWEIQMMGQPAPWLEVDVDKECIELLEIESFANLFDL